MAQSKLDFIDCAVAHKVRGVAYMPIVSFFSIRQQCKNLLGAILHSIRVPIHEIL